jgi:CheY-like chemotaxis protein
MAHHVGGERTIEEPAGMHVLIVGDDEHCRHFLREVLGLAGALVTATSVIDALAVTQVADLIVCDSAVAWASGGNLLRRLQYLHFRRGREAPAIVLLPPGTTSAAAQAAGFPYHLTKPVDGDRLRLLVGTLGRTTRAAAPRS